jgi:NAD(P)-dependent dehydrogenase (short-subunit alcohol dehydrogenase family)
VLVNNAGLALGLEPADRAEIGDWEEMLATNCAGVMYLTRAVLPQMVARGAGHIVNLGSVAGSYPYPGGNVYGATKAFVHQFSLNLRSDLHGTGVRVSCIEPGMCGGTEFSTIRFGGDDAKAEGVSSTKAIVFGDEGTPLASCAVPIDRQHPVAGAVEHDPAQILQAILDAGVQAMRDTPEPVVAIGVANQGETIVSSALVCRALSYRSYIV